MKKGKSYFLSISISVIALISIMVGEVSGQSTCINCVDTNPTFFFCNSGRNSGFCCDPTSTSANC